MRPAVAFDPVVFELDPKLNELLDDAGALDPPPKPLDAACGAAAPPGRDPWNIIGGAPPPPPKPPGTAVLLAPAPNMKGVEDGPLAVGVATLGANAKPPLPPPPPPNPLELGPALGLPDVPRNGLGANDGEGEGNGNGNADWVPNIPDCPPENGVDPNMPIVAPVDAAGLGVDGKAMPGMF